MAVITEEWTNVHNHKNADKMNVTESIHAIQKCFLCMHMCEYNYMSTPSYLADGFLSHLFLFPICTARYCIVVLTMRAGFVDKIAEVEQGGPGGQVLNEPLREGGKPQFTVIKRCRGKPLN